MQIPLTVSDFLDRAEIVYGDRAAVVDEPDQPAPSWGAVTYKDIARRARAQAAALDRLGVGAGARVAVVSHNSARLLTSFFGVSGYGRVLVPVNFRLRADEVAYIVEHSGSALVIVDTQPGFVDDDGMSDEARAVSARTVDRIAWLDARRPDLLDAAVALLSPGAGGVGD